MKRAQGGFAPIVIFAIAGAVLVLGAAYAYFHSQNAPAADSATPAQPADLYAARAKADAEQAKFDTLAKTFKSERPANSAFIDQFSKLAAASSKAAAGAIIAPKTASSTPGYGAFRTQMLAKIWSLKKSRDLALTHDTTPAAIGEMLDDANYLKSYLEANGGSQSDIGAVQGIIDSLEALKDALPPDNPQVTEGDLAKEQAALDEAKAEAAALEVDIAAASAPDAAPAQEDGGQPPPHIPPPPPDSISVQPGPPKLIQGDNND